MGRRLYHNRMSFLGGLVMAVGLVLVVASLGMLLSFGGASPYIGILTYLVFPAIVNLGLLLVLLGMWRESRRRLKGVTEEPPYPRIDLNDPRHRRTALWVLPALAAGGLLLAFVAYNGFLFTESVTFCGRLCHQVMQPEYASYLHSPHANVKCVECHVGPGAGWFVRSKLSGVHQVFAVLFDTYHRPIQTPIENLRPARETCEHCHWPKKFFGSQLLENAHFSYDRDSSAEQISFAVKTGGGGEGLGQGSGIHWHMIVSVQVEYAAADRERQVIPWFKVTRPDGTSEVYRDKQSKLSDEELAALPVRVMDCMDCHNRPTHIYGALDKVVDQALLGNRLPRDLPWIKREAVEALRQEYTSHEEAAEQIPEHVRAFYQEREPDLLRDAPEQVDAAAATIVDIYREHVFPAMKVSWGTYTNNIGHRNWPGCFRCHNDRHVSSSGKTLTRECSTCHTTPLRSPLTPLSDTLPSGTTEWHRMPLLGGHADLLCDTCHSAGHGEPPTCAECHGISLEAPMMADLDCTDCHERPGIVQPVADCLSCHEEQGGLHQHQPHHEQDCVTCHTPHGWNAATRETCLQCHDDMSDHMADEGACSDCHEFT